MGNAARHKKTKKKEQDALTRLYLLDNEVFADVINYHLYDGREVVVADQLHEMDTNALIVPYGKDGARTKLERHRDVLKY